MPTHLLIYNRDDEPNTPPPSNADILNDLVHHISGVHWRHAAKMGKKIDRERVLHALETYLSAPHTSVDPLPPAHDGSHANNEVGTSQTSQGVEYNRLGKELTDRLVPAPGAQDRAPLVDPLAEAFAILSIQRETANRSIPILAKNLEDEKMLLDEAKEFIQEAKDDSIPTSTVNLNLGRFLDAMSDRRIRIKRGIDLVKKSDSLGESRVQSAEQLEEQVVKAEKWLETNGYALVPARQIKQSLPRSDAWETGPEVHSQDAGDGGSGSAADHHSVSESDNDVSGEWDLEALLRSPQEHAGEPRQGVEEGGLESRASLR